MRDVVGEVRRDLAEAIAPVGQRQVAVPVVGQGLGEEAVLFGGREVAFDLGQGVGAEFASFQGVAPLDDRVGHHPAMLEGAAGVINPALVEVGRGGDGHHGLEVRRALRRELVLIGGEV